jgi:hypothetical protein
MAENGLIISLTCVRLLANWPKVFRTKLHMREFLHRTSFYSTSCYKYFFIGFDVLTVVVINSYEKLKNSIIWDIMLYGLLKFNRNFGGTCYPHLQGQRISQGGGNQNLVFASHWCLAWLLL